MNIVKTDRWRQSFVLLIWSLHQAGQKNVQLCMVKYFFVFNRFFISAFGKIYSFVPACLGR